MHVCQKLNLHFPAFDWTFHRRSGTGELQQATDAVTSSSHSIHTQWHHHGPAGRRIVVVAYKNSYRILTACDVVYVSYMANLVDDDVTRKAIFSLASRIDKSLNPIIQNNAINVLYVTITYSVDCSLI